MAEDDQPDLSAFGERSDADSDANRDVDTGDSADGEVDSDTTVDRETPDPSDAPVSITDLDRTERVELGVDLLRHVEHESLSVSEAVDRIETITTNPALTRKILDTAELRGVIERDGGRIRTRRGGTFVRFEQQVVHRDGAYTCRRCGASLETGRFVRFESGELGPFGPECLRTVLGRT